MKNYSITMDQNNQESYLQVGVKVFLKNENGEVLLLRRNPKKYPEIGPKWDIVGGRIDIGAPLLENLKREVKEETGLEITSEPKFLYAQDILNVERFPGRHVVRLTYVADTTGEPVVDHESLEFGWFSLVDMKKIPNGELDQYTKEVLEKFDI